jgi:hypothetical protein
MNFDICHNKQAGSNRIIPGGVGNFKDSIIRELRHPLMSSADFSVFTKRAILGKVSP